VTSSIAGPSAEPAPRRPGRPRADGASPTGRGTESDLLSAAARLFCTVGYTATSTRAIADAAGVRQASMYHWFGTKSAILQRLLLDSVEPSLESARLLLARPEEPAVRLWALARLDVELLCSGDLNIGALYLLPEVTGEGFETFREHREHLRAAYGELVSRATGSDAGNDGTGDGDTAAVVLTFVESVILRRRDEPDLDAARVAQRYADLALRLLGLDDDAVDRARKAGSVLADEVRPRKPVDRQN
jgi:AcrR family transcriptional regulator